MLFLILGFMLYGNTLGNDYALDDTIVITENQFTKQGLSGIDEHLLNDHFTGFYGEEKNLVAGGRYRPLSLIAFSIQYEIFGLQAWAGHLFNILFYVLNGFLLFMLLQKLFEARKSIDSIPLALLSSLLWFFHPIHTEAVANIKGLDEILSLSLSLLCLYYALLYHDRGSRKILLAIFACFFLSLLAKESAISWLAIIPCSLYFFRKLQTKKLISILFSVFSASVVWFLLRENAIGNKSIFDQAADNLMNDPFLFASTSEKYATIIYTMGKYIQLLIFPHPLTFDYYPKQIPIVDWAHPYVICTALVLLILLLVTIKGFREKSIVSYSILFYAIGLSVASNVLFPVGVFMSERFVYAPSIAFSICLAVFIDYTFKKTDFQKSKSILYPALALLFLLYGIKTFNRNFVWKDNYRLSTHDALVSVNGAKSNLMAGGSSLEKANEETNLIVKQQLLNESIYFLDRALDIYPEYVDAMLLMGNAQWSITNNSEKAIEQYLGILRMNPFHGNAWRNIHLVLEKETDKNRSIAIYEHLLNLFPNNTDIHLNLGRLYGQYKNDLQQAINFLEKGRSISPNNFEILSNLGTAYGMAKNYNKAIDVLEHAAKVKPNDAKIQADLGLSYYFSGQADKAKAAFDRAVQLNPNFDRSKFPV